MDAPAGFRDARGRHGGVVLPARPEPIAFDPAATALIVIDMQNAYASAGGYLDLAGFDVSGTGPVIARIARAVAAARAAGIRILWFQNGWDPDYVEAGGPGSPNWHKSNALKTMRRNPEMNAQLLAKGSWDYALVEGLTPGPGDIVMGKPRYSGFYNTALDSTLRSRGVNTLVFTGIATNVCVESTLRDGYHREYFGIVLADATHQAGPESLQQGALSNIETFFGWVSDVSTFEAALGAETRAAAE
ncbi:pyrimidine utilization protein B [Methylobacterium sp. NEAU K]|uniref:pyrimidine utilization protein B n=1 Tax=Methylobacterium sp. NEAU K TaxID=3064946 RepID=UPI002736AF17|nr:pyrimidine utilization protein B [Methylobacterium sp. NEAU K]MDP4005821.1 pyrimidine utilization protein B [Methylobacterium sp. NEAU K]